MKKAILGKKLGMTQVFSQDGKVFPVTVILAGPCTVIQKKTVENHLNLALKELRDVIGLYLIIYIMLMH